MITDLRLGEVGMQEGRCVDEQVRARLVTIAKSDSKMSAAPAPPVPPPPTVHRAETSRDPAFRQY